MPVEPSGQSCLANPSVTSPTGCLLIETAALTSVFDRDDVDSLNHTHWSSGEKTTSLQNVECTCLVLG